MFSGIVECTGRVEQFLRLEQGARLTLARPQGWNDLSLGDSVCINGVCLTVVELSATTLQFDLAAETVRRTMFQDLNAGDSVNLERSLRVGDRVHGHFVFGHVDGVSELLQREAEGESDKLTFSLPADLQRYVATKGSISVSGISLTVGEVTHETFCVYIIPHTSEVTALKNLHPGGRVNLEVDMLARYVVSALAQERS